MHFSKCKNEKGHSMHFNRSNMTLQHTSFFNMAFISHIQKPHVSVIKI